MRFLPWIEGKQFLIIYPLYVIFMLLLLFLICKREDRDFCAYNINEDEYYVLKRIENLKIASYNARSIIRYFTFKLFSKGFIKSCDEKSGLFIKVLNKDTRELSRIECILYDQYSEEKSIDKIDITEELNREIINFYEDVKGNLKGRGLINDEEIISENKKRGLLIMFAIIIPGVWRLIGGIVSGMASAYLVFEIVGAITAYVVVSSIFIGGKVTKIGKESCNLYAESYRRSYRKSKYDDVDFTNGSVNSSEFMAYYLIFNYGSGYFGPMHGISHGYIGTSCSACSSCSSCSSNSCSSCSSSSGSSCSSSSCSSCSSGCGGCGGGSD